MRLSDATCARRISPMDTRRSHDAADRSPSRRRDGVYCDTLVVPEDAIDGNGHVNNVTYVQWMQDVAVAHFRSVGGVDVMERAGGTWVVRSHQIEYLRPAYRGDRIEVRTWVVDYGRVRSHRRYEFVRQADGETLSRGETEWVFVDAETGRPRSIPQGIRDVFATKSGGGRP
jgi:acyl-CoA thioester hydrolase